jgi:hypothetical protein
LFFSFSLNLSVSQAKRSSHPRNYQKIK